MKLKRQRLSSVLPEHHEVFNRLLVHPVVKRFLAWDKNLRVSDKFQRIHFFVALYLANDMEEDNQAPKQAIFSFLYGKNRSQRPLFHKLRFQFIRSMGWKTRVSREECEELPEPRGDAGFQQEVHLDANDRPEEGREESLVQIIWKNLEPSRMS
ncbi:speedy protein C isoform X1 [Prionailurus iriomotensis]